MASLSGLPRGARRSDERDVGQRDGVHLTSSLSCKGAGWTPFERPPPYRRPCQLQGLVRRPVLPDHRGLTGFSVRSLSSLRIPTVFSAARCLRLRLPRCQPVLRRACTPRAQRIARGLRPSRSQLAPGHAPTKSWFPHEWPTASMPTAREDMTSVPRCRFCGNGRHGFSGGDRSAVTTFVRTFPESPKPTSVDLVSFGRAMSFSRATSERLTVRRTEGEDTRLHARRDSSG